MAGRAGGGLADPHVPLTAGNALSTWQLAPIVSAITIILAAAYLLGTWRVARRHPARPWPVRRTLAFLLGLAVVTAATQSSIGAYDDVLFSVHMIQHLLLIMVAPPYSWPAARSRWYCTRRATRCTPGSNGRCVPGW